MRQFAVIIAFALVACESGSSAPGIVPLDTSGTPGSDVVSPGPDGFTEPDALPDPCATGPVVGEPCLYRTCDSGCVCVTTQIVDGTACDGGACLVGPGECKAGACVGVPVDCDDGEPCTDDGCERGRGCVHAAREQFSYCDVDPCRSEICSGDGRCYALSSAFDAGAPCGDAYCDKSGACVPKDALSLGVFGDSCDDGKDCESGECVAGLDGARVCSYRCYRGGGDCPAGWLCGSGNGPACMPADYGAPCASSDACSSGCVEASAGADGFCTSNCWPWSCPDGFVCELGPGPHLPKDLPYCRPVASGP